MTISPLCLESAVAVVTGAGAVIGAPSQGVPSDLAWAGIETTGRPWKT
jgi:hypothetical protein